MYNIKNKMEEESSLFKNIEIYIKWCLIELSTNASIRHRAYFRDEHKESALAQMMNKYNDMDKSIHKLTELIISDENFNDMILKYKKMKLFHDNNENNEDDVDYIDEYECESDLYIMFITPIYKKMGHF